ncbi:hypothetical protein CAEBREN_02454 [Caenorhabditis brenneri]|uniref:Uncharacterized protein n=1 Tax=Caenorhabditis brenneri TaxID=135651 RepID=G0PIW8_CAEBE|nr:hypothetical protein CAEBREN_02454 [Caenorhabditis brenneri]
MSGIKVIPKTVHRDVMMAKLIEKLSMEDAPAKNDNPDELRFTFASPDTAVFSNAVVKQVDVPTLAGMVHVLANHVPTIGILSCLGDHNGRLMISMSPLPVLSLNLPEEPPDEGSEVARAEAQEPEKTTEYLESFLGKDPAESSQIPSCNTKLWKKTAAQARLHRRAFCLPSH